MLKGGDHGTKLAAEKRFKQADGPRVMICTAAGREGINLQHARVLFNFDLPWNPMDVEQRIGRIHRYGQQDTAQAYNLVLGDTIEGKIFLLLDDKLKDIARALGKLDDQGNVAEDLRSQILGQLSERVNYQQLYSQALQDPELKRTRLELEAAMTNAAEARDVVFELFQDLDRFSLDDYAPLSHTKEGMSDLVRFITAACEQDGMTFQRENETHFALVNSQGIQQSLFTTDRDEANENDALELIGLDHPFIEKLLSRHRELPPDEIGLAIQSLDGENGVLSIWLVETHNDKGQTLHQVTKIGMDRNGKRVPAWEKQAESFYQHPIDDSKLDGTTLFTMTETIVERELKHRGIIKDDQSYSAELIGWNQFGNGTD